MSPEPCYTGLALKGVEETHARKRRVETAQRVRGRHRFCTLLLHAPRMGKKDGKCVGA